MQKLAYLLVFLHKIIAEKSLGGKNETAHRPLPVLAGIRDGTLPDPSQKLSDLLFYGRLHRGRVLSVLRLLGAEAPAFPGPGQILGHKKRQSTETVFFALIFLRSFNKTGL